MNRLSTFIEYPTQIHLFQQIDIQSLIVDLPFCSVRPFNPYDWTNDELNQLDQKINYQHLILNIDGIYTDHELQIIQSTILSRKLFNIFDGFRIQDIGLIQWIQCHFPNQTIQLNSETSGQNLSWFKPLSSINLSTVVLNSELLNFEFL